MHLTKITFALACALLCGIARAQNTLNLSTLDTSALSDGDTVASGVTYSSSGTLTFTEAYTLSGTSSLGLVAGGEVTLTLDGVTISTPAGLSPLSTGDKNLTVVLADGTSNTLTPAASTSSYNIVAGIEVGNGTLTIEGNTGSLTVSGGVYSAAIGTYGAESSSTAQATGSITIAGGVINATGGGRGAAIGGAQYRSFTGTISITGGDVTAQGGSGGAGIGMGYYQASAVSSISISGGTVHATGGTGGAGIGAAYGSAAVGSITISNGAEVTATGGSSAAGIGGGYASSSCDVTISGATTSVVAYAGSNAAYAIGYGVARSGETLSAGTLTVSDGASVNTNGGSTPDGTALGALVINLANPVADTANGITFSGTTDNLLITVASTKTLILQGQASITITLLLPDGAKLSCPTGSAYAASLSAIRCLGSMTIEGDNTLTVDSFVLGYDSETGLGSDASTLTLSATSDDTDMALVVNASCTGKVLCDGYVAVTLPSSSNLGAYTPLASVTTGDGTFPYAYTDSVDFSTLTRNATLPSDWSLDTSSTSCITLTAPSGATLTQSGTTAVEHLSVQLSGDATLSGVTLSVPAAYPAIALPENSTLSLTLSDTNTLSASTAPAIEVPSSANLTLTGSGSLSASATTAAAIGCGGYDTSVNAGIINIALGEGGSLSASATYGAGIGGGARVGVSSVTIASGTVSAASTYGAAIGSGYNVTSSATTPTIALSGGSVTATSASGDPIGSNSATNKAILRVSNLGTTKVDAKTYATIPVVSGNGTSVTNLSDAIGLTILEVIDDDSTAIIAETRGTESCNLVTARQTSTGISTSEGGTPVLTLADCASLLSAGGTYLLATSEGTPVARLDGNASTLTILDGTLSIEGSVTVQTNTGKSTPDTLTDPESLCALLEAALAIANDSGTLSLSYAYNFGIQALKMNTTRNDDGSLSFALLTVGLTEGTVASQSGRNVTLSNATLAIYSGDTLIQSLDSPTFTEGVCNMTPTSTLSAEVVSLPLVVKLLPLATE